VNVLHWRTKEQIFSVLNRAACNNQSYECSMYLPEMEDLSFGNASNASVCEFIIHAEPT
jgi:hypothetical protein